MILHASPEEKVRVHITELIKSLEEIELNRCFSYKTKPNQEAIAEIQSIQQTLNEIGKKLSSLSY